MKQINTPKQVSEALGFKPKKKYNYTKKTGRPQKTLETLGLPDNWKQTVLELAALGKSEVQIRAALTLTWKGKGKRAKPTFHQGIWDALQAREEEFSSTIKISKVLCEAWWQNIGQDKLVHTTFEAFETASWFINMKNRFGWKDKTEVDHGIADESYEKYKNMPVSDLLAKVALLAPKK